MVSRSVRIVGVLCTVLLVGLAVWAVDAPQAGIDERVGASDLLIGTHTPFDRAVVKVSGPEGYDLTKVFNSGVSLQIDLLKGRLAEVEAKVPEPNAKAVQPVVVEKLPATSADQAPLAEQRVKPAAKEKSAPVPDQGLTLPDGRYSYEVRLWAGGEEKSVFSGVFFVEGGLAVSRDAVRSRMEGTREDVAREGGDTATTKSYYTADYLGVNDGADDGITTFALDSDSPVNNAYWDMSNVNGNIRFGYGGNGATPGSPRVTFESGGDVGIGTTNPNALLDIASGIPDIRFTDTGSGQVWYLEMLNDDIDFYDSTGLATPFHIEHGADNNALYINGAGEVGFGADPATTSALNADIFGRTNEYFIDFTLENNAGDYWLIERTDQLMGHCMSNSAQDFWTCPYYEYEDAPSHLLNLTPTGIGVNTGTSAPTNLLTVRNGTLRIERNDGVTPNIRFYTTGGGATRSWLFQNNSATGVFAIRDETAGNSPFRVYPGGAESTLTVRNGRVGVATGNPLGTLDVNGSIYQRGGVLHADYVFQPGYKLESIEDHAASMWRDQHLPSVPEAVTDGEGREVIEVGAHQRGILEELEKAHIYIEQLSTQLKAKDTVIDQLKAQNDQILERLTQLEAQIAH